MRKRKLMLDVEEMECLHSMCGVTRSEELRSRVAVREKMNYALNGRILK